MAKKPPKREQFPSATSVDRQPPKPTPEWLRRYNIAASADTPDDVLHQLAKDKDPAVQWRAKRALEVRAKKSSVATIKNKT
jgi:hypothetical protein